MNHTKLLLTLAGGVLLSLGLLLGCGDVGVDDKASPVWLEVTDSYYEEVGQDVAEIDVCDLELDDDTELFYCTYFDEFLEVSFMTHAVTPYGYDNEDQTPYLDIHIKHYRVSYFRTDGGQNVPGTYDEYCDLWCPYEDEVTHRIKILHADQKLDPPLIWLNALESFGYCIETGEPIIKGFVVIQFWGKDNSGKNVEATTQFPVQFADWGDDY